MLVFTKGTRMSDYIRFIYITFSLIARSPNITDGWECNVLGKKK